MLLPLAWETHSSPELSGRPQQQINDRILKYADILVGIFWTRAGSSTGKSISGSIEEIREHHSNGKPVMLYFSSKPIIPERIDRVQYDLLEGFRVWAKSNGLVSSFRDNDDFHKQFSEHLSRCLYENTYIKTIIAKEINFDITILNQDRPNSLNLTDDEKALLSAAVNDENGYIRNSSAIGGLTMYADKKTFGQDGNVRELARWEAALNGLANKKLISDKNGKRTVFSVTDLGYRICKIEQA